MQKTFVIRMYNKHIAYLHNDVNISGAVHAVVHGHEVGVMQSRELAQDLYLLHQDLWRFLNAFLRYHLHRHRLWRVLFKNKDQSVKVCFSQLCLKIFAYK